MTEPRAPRVRRARLLAALMLAFVLTPSAAHAIIKQSNVSIPARATWTGVDGSAATGRCMLLFTFLRTKALGHCTIEGGAPLTSIQLWVDGFDTPVFATPVSGSGPFTFTVEPLPTVVVRAFPSGALRVEGHTSAGLETSGTFREATAAVLFTVSVHGGETVPPGSSTAFAFCIVTVIGAPSFLGVDCAHDLPDPQSFALHSGPAFETGDVSVDLSAALSSTHPAAWQPLDDLVRLTMAVDGTYLRMVGAGEGAVIRGQVNGCRTSNSTACMFGRFTVRASGEPTDQSVPNLPASGEILAASFNNLIVTTDEFARTQTALFSVTANRDYSLLVEMVDGCSTGQGFILNAVATDFEAFQHFVFFTDLIFQRQDALTTAGGLRLERRRAYGLACPPQR